MLVVRLLEEREFAGLRQQWNAFVSKCAWASPMITWEWLYAWWCCYKETGPKRDLYILGVFDPAGQLVGLAPFLKREYRRFGLSFRAIEFLGTGEKEADETCSEFLDVLVDPVCRENVIDAFAEHLSSDPDWDQIVLKDIREDVASNVGLFVRALRKVDGLEVREDSKSICPAIYLPGSWKSYLSSISSKRAHRIEYERRRILGAAKIAYSTITRREDMRRAYNIFVDLHQRLWTSRGKPGCFASNSFGRFLENATELMTEEGKCRVSILSADGTPVAAFYMLLQGKRLYYYNSGISPDVFSEYSPGNVGLGYIIEEAIEEGLEEFHFFKGRMDSYKSHWTGSSVSVVSVRCLRRNIKQQVFFVADRMIGCLRRFRRVFSTNE